MEKKKSLISSQAQWGAIAEDLALMSLPEMLEDINVESIAAAYDMSLDELGQLLKLPMFRNMVTSEVQRIKIQGPNAGHMHRMRALSKELSEMLYLRAQSGAMEAKDMIALLKTFMESGNILKPEDTKEATAMAGVNLTINIPNLNNPKLDHLRSGIIEA